MPHDRREFLHAGHRIVGGDAPNGAEGWDRSRGRVPSDARRRRDQLTGITTTDMSDVAAELRAALAEHDEVCARLSDAERDHKRAYLTAHANSTTIHPDRRVKEHEVAAEEGSFNEWAALNALVYRKRALAERLHSLRQVLSSFQTQARIEADFDNRVAS